jgi:3-phytase
MYFVIVKMELSNNGNFFIGVEGTDGLDVSSFPLGNMYPEGILVVQDGNNKDKEISSPQNFKIVKWDSIASKFNPPLIF